MSAGVYDFIVEQGVPYAFQVQYKNPDGTGKNLTSWIASGQVKEKFNDCTALGDLDIDIVEPLVGVMLVTVPKEITEVLKIKGNRYSDYIKLVYDIKLWPASDITDIRRLLNGTISVSPEVTR
ncbi:MAG: hypothetical protein CMC55_06770 [Flavobacteriaceae bacterium]|nr:hypothetical protein [Flavobacteriaceae bacterium]|tara:strand:- start:22 stop:390 length:369 start_codon:yes stop_codon:yes gene_type:complete